MKDVANSPDWGHLLPRYILLVYCKMNYTDITGKCVCI